MAITKRRARMRAAARDLSRRGEAGLGADHSDAETGETLLGIVGRDGGDHALDMVMDGGEVHVRLARVDAEPAGLAHGVAAWAAAISDFDGTQP